MSLSRVSFTEDGGAGTLPSNLATWVLNFEFVCCDLGPPSFSLLKASRRASSLLLDSSGNHRRPTKRKDTMANQRVTRSTLRSVNIDVRRIQSEEGSLLSVPRARRAGMPNLRRMPYPAQTINPANAEPPMRLRGRPVSRTVQEREVNREILSKSYNICNPEGSVTSKSVRIECPPSPTFLPCPICFAEMAPSSGCPISSLRCGHVFCRDCLQKSLSNNSCCPICMAQVNPGDVRPIYLQ